MMAKGDREVEKISDRRLEKKYCKVEKERGVDERRQLTRGLINHEIILSEEKQGQLESFG